VVAGGEVELRDVGLRGALTRPPLPDGPVERLVLLVAEVPVVVSPLSLPQTPEPTQKQKTQSSGVLVCGARAEPSAAISAAGRLPSLG
jgi:hypothetical protein